MAKVKVGGDRRLSKVQLFASNFADELMERFRVDCGISRYGSRTGVVQNEECLGLSIVFLTYEIARMRVNVWVQVLDRAALFKGCVDAGLEIYRVQWRTWGAIGDTNGLERWNDVTLNVPDLLGRLEGDRELSKLLVLQPVMGEVGLLVNSGEQKVVIDTVQRGERFGVRAGEWLETCPFMDVEQFKLAQDWANARTAELKGIMARRLAEQALNGRTIYPDYGNGRLFK